MSLTQRVATSYDHVQSTPSATWTIVHNLGAYPIVDAYIEYAGELQRILPSAVTYVDENTCTLSFATPRAGFATVV